MKKSCEIIGLTVVSIQEGKELGTVGRLVIDAAAANVAALLLDDQKWYLGAKALPFSAVSGLGEYAVTINSEADVAAIAPASSTAQLLAADIAVVGTLAVTRDGHNRGTVTEFCIDDAGSITECIIESEGETYSLSAERVVTYGRDVLVIAAENELPVRVKPELPAAAVTVEAAPATASEPVVSPVVTEVAAETVEPAVVFEPAAEVTAVEPASEAVAAAPDTAIDPDTCWTPG